MAEMTTFERRLAEALSEYAGPTLAVDQFAIARRAAQAPARPQVRWSWRPAVSVAAAALAAFAAVTLALVLLRSTFPPAIPGSPSPHASNAPADSLDPDSSTPPAESLDPRASPAPAESLIPEASPAPTPTPSTPAFFLGDSNGPGRYNLIGNGALVGSGWPGRVDLELPDGSWYGGSLESNAGFTKYSNFDGKALASVTGSSVEWVPASPCRGSVANRIGQSVADLAAALRAMPLISISDSAPVAVDGYGGLLVTVEVPDTPECEIATFWHGPQERSAESSRGTSLRGWSNDIYMLDVDGTRWVLQVALAPDATDELRAEVRAMVNTVDIVGPAGLGLPALSMPGFNSAGAAPGWYGLEGRPGGGGGMHWVVGDGVGEFGYEAAEMFFAIGPDCLVRAGNPDPTPIQVGDLQGVTVYPYEPAWSFGGAEGDEVTRAYALDVEGRTLCVFLTTGSSTTPEQMEAALAIVESIQAVPLGEDGIRLIFNLADGGWDTG